MSDRLRARALPRALAVLLSLLLVATTGVTQASAAPSGIDDAPPASIRVCRSSGAVDTVPFKTYVRQVLPREFPTHYDFEALKAGAIAVKSYAWYWTRHPWRPGTCDLSDTTRHQKYDPNDTVNPPNATSNAAVDQTWHLRLWDTDRDDVLFAQYCNCSSHPAGKSINQPQANEQGASGWSTAEIVDYGYRNMPHVLDDWRAGLGVSWPAGAPYAVNADAAFQPAADVRGVGAGDDRAQVALYVQCEINDREANHHVQTVGVARTSDGRTVAAFDQGDEVKACAETEVLLIAVLAVNGYPVVQRTVVAWSPWRSAEPREVTRIADTDDPIEAALRISRLVFDAAPEAAAGSGPDAQPDIVPDPLPEALDVRAGQALSASTRGADHAVLARSDTFADALAATGLAGPSGPILLHPGGPDAAVDARVRAEIDRVLVEGGRVDIVGGTKAVSAAVEDDLRADGYEVTRFAGPSRIETALVVADGIRDRGGVTDSVLLVRAYPDTSAGWADAITGGAYAATMRHPVLLTSPTTLDARSQAWVEDPGNGVREVVVLGGPRAVPPTAESDLDVEVVTRLSGANRAATSRAIAIGLWTRPEAPDISGAMIIEGYDDLAWPYGLAGAVYAANAGTPQLLVTHLVPRHTVGRWLDDHPGLPAVIVGGPQTVAARIDGDIAGS